MIFLLTQGGSLILSRWNTDALEKRMKVFP